MGVLNPIKSVVMIRIESKVNIEKHIIPYLTIRPSNFDVSIQK